MTADGEYMPQPSSARGDRGGACSVIDLRAKDRRTALAPGRTLEEAAFDAALGTTMKVPMTLGRWHFVEPRLRRSGGFATIAYAGIGAWRILMASVSATGVTLIMTRLDPSISAEVFGAVP